MKEIVGIIHHKVRHDQMPAWCLDDGSKLCHTWALEITPLCRYIWNIVPALHLSRKQLCLTELHYDFIAWWTCRSQLVHKSILREGERHCGAVSESRSHSDLKTTGTVDKTDSTSLRGWKDYGKSKFAKVLKYPFRQTCTFAYAVGVRGHGRASFTD